MSYNVINIKGVSLKILYSFIHATKSRLGNIILPDRDSSVEIVFITYILIFFLDFFNQYIWISIKLEEAN